ncbi:MAG: L-threonylcarbamoyladenylate synthase [Candidatus Omnitrophota bacterium]|nr:L-threonylcarbamoyladenylate synthase [Candidatus Omnitrophota bacterium]
MNTEIIQINPQNPEPDRISHCARILHDGGLVAFPTETVYGLAANLNNKKAINKLFEVKKRHHGKPFSVHIAEKEQVEEHAINLKPVAYKLIDKFWPGPLTIIVPSKDKDTVGIRMPRNAIALKLIAEANVPVVAPSANLTGNSSPKSADDVLRDLNGLIEVVIDGGKTELGIDSSIVDLTVTPPQILRKGAISDKEIEQVINKKTVLFVCTGNSCRSVMAEALFKNKTAGREDIEVLDAGVGAMRGMGPTADTITLLNKEGIDVMGHKATPITDIMIKKSDIILVMEKLHEERILKKVPSARNRLYLLKEFAKMTGPGMDLNIYDPIGKPSWFYEECFATIKEAINRIGDLI